MWCLSSSGSWHNAGQDERKFSVLYQQERGKAKSEEPFHKPGHPVLPIFLPSLSKWYIRAVSTYDIYTHRNHLYLCKLPHKTWKLNSWAELDEESSPQSMRRRNSENDELLGGEEPKGTSKYMSRENLLLLFYVVMAVLVGTANRVTFKVRIRRSSTAHRNSVTNEM